MPGILATTHIMNITVTAAIIQPMHHYGTGLINQLRFLRKRNLASDLVLKTEPKKVRPEYTRSFLRMVLGA